MSELSETEACDVLASLFRARGYTIQRNIPFKEYGVEFHIDGWDARNRIGFEFLSSEDDDHDDLSLEEYKTLAAAQQRGELSMFIIDEVEPLSAEELKAAAHEFLDEAAEAVLARRSGRRPRKKAPAARRSVAHSRGNAAGKKTVRKATGTKKAAVGKKAAKKAGKAAATSDGKTTRKTSTQRVPAVRKKSVRGSARGRR